MPGRDATSDDLRARLAAREDGPDLRHRTPELTDVVVSAMRAQVPAFAVAPPEFEAIVEFVVSRIVEQILTLFHEVRPASRAEVRELVELCVPSTDQGITLEDMLNVFALAQETLWAVLHELSTAGDLTDPELALELSQVGVTLLAGLSRGVTAEYLRGDRVWLQRRDAERALVRGVLATPPRPEEATRAAHALDLQLHGRWRCALYQPMGDERDVDGLRDALEDARLTWGTRAAITVDEGRVLVCQQAGEPLPPPEGTAVGVGSEGEGTMGLRTSYDEAQDALAVGLRTGRHHTTVEDARLGRVVLGALSATAMADEVLAPIDGEPDGRREMLTETLEAWLAEQGSATAVGRRLQLHVQSARYRIEQLRGLLGDAMDEPDGRLQLHLALTARRLGPAADGPG